MARTKTTMQIHGVSFKFVPFIFLLIAFLFYSPYSPDVPLPALESAFISIAFVIGGVAFLYEGVYAWPKKGGNQSSMVGSIFFWIAGGGSIALGLLAWITDSNPLVSGDFMQIAQIILIADMIMLFIGTLFEIVMSHRLSHVMSGKPKDKVLN